ncbi:MAG: lysine transporter LysE [Desulfovibrio sp.]|nr:lysine transporter LysE [Desulfovibrio sp.]|tara:strand:+ start:86 stop:709 length:624 start_codon:yes stop_codon:yes gene_type:complete
MPIETYCAFLVASIVILIIPGPTIMLVVSCSLAQGKRAALPLALGVGLGDMVALIASMVGLGALLATSAAMFTILKWIGAIYLMYLGIKMWRTRPEVGASMANMRAESRRSHVLRAFVVTATNPKSIAFFCAFLPQFIDHSMPVLPQVCILGVTFVTLAVINAALYALLAVRARAAVSSPYAMKMVNRTGGTALIGAGLLTAALRRA